MSTSTKRCRICLADLPETEVVPACKEKGCQDVWGICFTSVADGIKHGIPRASQESLVRALDLERGRPSPRRVLVLAIERRLNRLATTSCEALLVRTKAHHMADTALLTDVARCRRGIEVAASTSARARFVRRLEIMSAEAVSRGLLKSGEAK